MEEDITEEEIKEALLILVDTGRVLGKCPKCLIPLSYNEITNDNCNKCGEISFDQVTFFQTSEQKN